MLAQISTPFGPANRGEPLPAPGECRAIVKKSAPGCVLVVDDDALVRWSVSETLRACGYDVLEADAAETAVRVLLEGHRGPDVVMLDLRLPDCTDFRLVEIVHAMRPAMPIILMTSFGTPDIARRAGLSGARMVLEKPFDVSALEPLIAGLLR